MFVNLGIQVESGIYVILIKKKHHRMLYICRKQLNYNDSLLKLKISQLLQSFVKKSNFVGADRIKRLFIF